MLVHPRHFVNVFLAYRFGMQRAHYLVARTYPKRCSHKYEGLSCFPKRFNATNVAGKLLCAAMGALNITASQMAAFRPTSS
jgi:hypothetical protein